MSAPDVIYAKATGLKGDALKFASSDPVRAHWPGYTKYLCASDELVALIEAARELYAICEIAGQIPAAQDGYFEAAAKQRLAALAYVRSLKGAAE